jgi:glycosyltransferase involved in cell wall biosynthesis
MSVVLHVINRFSTSGGAENQLYSNLRSFDHPNLEHRVLAIFGGSADDPLPEIRKRSLYPIGSTPSRWEIIRGVSSAVAGEKPDIIHCSLADAALAARLVGARRSIPVVESLVNIAHEDVRTQDNPSVSAGKLAVHRAIDRFTMGRVTRFHALTERVRDSWHRDVGIPLERVTVIPRGIDLARFETQPGTREATRRSLGVGADTPLLLNVARREPQKGQRYLLEAVPRLLERHPDLVVAIAGRDGNSSAVLNDLVDQLGIAAHVRFLGVRDDVPRLLAAADVFVFPSLFEGLGVSLLEAMSSGTAACAVSDASPFDEIVDPGTTGVMFRTADATDLASVVGSLLDDSGLRKKMTDAARAEIVANYRIEDVSRRLEAMYLDVLSAR